MKIQYTLYVIATAERPTLFLDSSTGELVDDLESASLFDNECLANNAISKLDEPEKFILLPVTQSVEV